jgi:hypothetical protein
MLIAYRDSKTTNTLLLSPRAKKTFNRAVLLTVFIETVKELSHKLTKYGSETV